jgi:tetratricopeptide (TPR) repeat protein
MTPLLRRVYGMFLAFVILYLGILGAQYSTWHKERLYRQLIVGSEQEKASAAFDLAYLNGEEQLLRALRSQSPEIRLVAVNSLWNLWARAGGHRAFRQVQAANRAIERKAYPEALDILTRLTHTDPDFPEGWNRRATLYWELGHFEESLADARKVVALNPRHFGAWQGMGMCLVHLGDLEEACQCLEAALRITPHDPSVKAALRRCQELRQLFSPHHQEHDEII